MNIKKIREDFPILKRELKGKRLVYLDNAATAQKPFQVIEAISDYYTNRNANTHRSIYRLGEESTEQYESSREKLAAFINASPKETIFTKGATDSLNMAANTLSSRLSRGDEILLTEMEHHSNLIPWQQIAARTGAKIKFIPITPFGELDLSSQEMISKKTKIVSVTHMSNVLGTINPVAELAKKAHDNNALFVLDAAQSAPQMKIDAKRLDADIIAFSGHKMMGPTGTGILFGKKGLLEELPPAAYGGNMIRKVTYKDAEWNDLPWKFEAGTPNIAGSIGLGAAAEYIRRIGIQNISDYEEKLSKKINNLFSQAGFLDLQGPENRRSVFSFNLKGVHAHDTASLLDDFSIAVRAGHHCAMPLMSRLGKDSTVRASFYIYNNFEEAEYLLESLKKVKGVFAR